MLEYGRRLRLRRRALSGTETQPNVGAWLWLQAASAAAPTGVVTGRIAAGQRADFVVLDADDPQLAGRRGDALLDSLVFVNAGAAPIREVWVGGKPIVADGYHAHEEQAARDYSRTLARMRDAS